MKPIFLFIPIFGLFILFFVNCVELTHCDDLNRAMADFAKQNNSCSTSDDCMIVGPGDCSTFGFTTGAISKTAVEASAPYRKRLGDCRDYYSNKNPNGHYISFAHHAICVSGHCEAVVQGCGNSDM